MRLVLAVSTAIMLTGCHKTIHVQTTPGPPSEVAIPDNVTIKARPNMTIAPPGHTAYVRLEVHVDRNVLNRHLRVEVLDMSDGGQGYAVRSSEVDLEGERAIASFRYEYQLDQGNYVARATVTKSNGNEKIATDSIQVH